MFYFNPYAILPFVTATITLCLGIIVFVRNKAAGINRIFLFWCVSSFVWLFNYSICYSTNNESLALTCSKLACITVIILSVLFYHFMAAFIESSLDRKIACFLYFSLFSLYPLAFSTNYILSGTFKYFFGFYGRAGPLYKYLIILFAACAARGLFILCKAVRNRSLSSHRYIQAKYILTGFLFALFASVDFLPKFNIEMYPFGSIFFIIWVIIMTYAILKHQLMDINIVLRKGLIYSILIAVLTVFYLILVLIIERLFQNLIGYRSLVISISYAFIIALSFIPLRNKIQSFIDKYFFKGTQHEISEENKKLRQEVIKTEKLKAVADLASGVAHEIRNPLSAIKTFFEYFPEKRNDPEFLDKFNNIVGDEIHRIDNLVGELLDFAKPSPLAKEQVQINELINNTLNLLSNKLKVQNIQTAKDFQLDNNSSLMADPNKLEQAFLNIFLNAIDAMENGGTLTIKTQNIECNSQNFIEICILDTGCGIQAEDLDHIFDPFFSKKDKGTGLGLAITQGIIQNHVGKISVKSTVGTGAMFLIELPELKEAL